MNNLLVGSIAILAFGGMVLISPGVTARPDELRLGTECAPSPIASTMLRLSEQETTINGTPEADGWQRFEPATGVSFLFPGSAQRATWPQETEIGKLQRKIYTYEAPKHMFAVEVVDGFGAKAGQSHSPGQEAKLIAILEENLRHRAFNLSQARIITGASPSRRDYSFFIADTYVNGEARIYYTSTRAVVVIAMRKGRAVDEGPVTRFLDSVRVGEAEGVRS